MANPAQPETKTLGEVQSSVTLVDFLDLWSRHARTFLIGLIIVIVVAFAWSRLLRTVYYRAETTFSIGSQFTSNSRIGLSETNLFDANRSDKFVLLQILQAQEWLGSRELLVEAARRLAQPGDPDQTPIDVYALLRVQGGTAENREIRLTDLFKRDLTKVIQQQNSGVMILRVELPDGVAAARFANAALDILKQRFTEDNFRYFDHVTSVYEDGLKSAQAMRRQLAGDLLGVGPYDANPLVQERRSALLAELDRQAQSMGTLVDTIQLLRIATDERAKAAAQPITLIEQAYPPLEKSRPQNMMTAFLAGCIYSFAFILGLVWIGFLRVVRRERPPTGGAA